MFRHRSEHRRKEPFKDKDLQLLFDLQDALPDLERFEYRNHWYHKNKWLNENAEQVIQAIDIFGQERVADFLGMTEYLIRSWRSRVNDN